MSEEWFTEIMSFARERFLLRGEEPEPMAFLKTRGGLTIAQLALDKEFWAEVLKRIVAETNGCISVGLLTTGWQGGTVSEDEEIRVMPHDDPKRQPVAVFNIKDRGGPTRMYLLPFDQVGDDGPVTWCADEWKEHGNAEEGGEIRSRFLDGVFEN